jgi:hypothetical protein
MGTTNFLMMASSVKNRKEGKEGDDGELGLYSTAGMASRRHASSVRTH